ncbi:MAG TPA: RidA family protein [Burkholderiaceae bacterium]|nr:RidA family protein [Burkholderiaceae bacterium]
MKPLRQEFRVDALPEPLSHYTDAVRFGNVLYVAGLTPLDKDMQIVGGEDVVEQTRQVFRNLRSVLEAAGGSFSQILRMNIFLTDISDRAAINAVRREYLGTSRPASTLVEVSALAVAGMKVEVEVTVGLPDN